MLLYILASTIGISLLSLLGIFTLYFKDKFVKRIILILVSLSAGALFGGALFHLLPEAVEQMDVTLAMLIVLLGYVLFFILEKVLHWRHCHKGVCKVHTFGYINLFGDAIHNFIDGLVIAASFTTQMSLGIATVFAMGLHEVPQEIGDFGVLLHSGFHKKKALFYNFITAITVIIGGLAGYYLSGIIGGITVFLLPFAAGGFIYISSSDLIPEIRKESKVIKWFLNFATFLLGIALMYSLTFLE